MIKNALAMYSVERILPLVGENTHLPSSFGSWGCEFNPKLHSSRMRCFKESKKCCVCGKEGNIFVLMIEAGASKACLNMYHYEPKADMPWILMTQDHIIPKSFGGTCYQPNLQTMCSDCNGKKGNDLTNEDIIFLCRNKKGRAYLRWFVNSSPKKVRVG